MPIDHDNVVRVLMRDRAKLYAYIWAIVHDEHLTEDVLQEVCALVVSKQDEIESEAHLLGWTRRSARYVALRMLEKHQRFHVGLSEKVLDLMESDWRRIDQMETSDAIDALRRCLAKLTPYASRLIHLRYVEGIKGTRLAEAVDRKLETVYSALSRTHRALSDCIRNQLAGGSL